ncbi:DUF4301 family protein [Ekhidna sp.]|uniref:DUF4301 family protein n=1 Tax=Ekhidna sp. TaxID=2608089 RepID=UPI003CCBDDE3
MEKFSSADKAKIERKGLKEEQVENQLKRFKNGFPSAHLIAAASVEDGIKKISKEELDAFISHYDRSDVEVMKFVPASGAATRMFKGLYAFLDKYDGTPDSFESISREEKKIGKFFSDLDEFAFYESLNEKMLEKHQCSVNDAKSKNQYDEIVKLLLNEEGLNYGKLPKGLLKFHTYENEERTAAQEHLHEGIAYAKKARKVTLHFTVSPEHLSDFKNHIIESIDSLNTEAEIDVSFSTQKEHTDTIASTLDFKPFRDEKGQLLFRPAGHGALLQNLNELDADLIFIKNIDNVVPDKLKTETIRYKKVLAGVLLHYQEKAFDLLKNSEVGNDIITKEGRSLLNEMGVRHFSDDKIPVLLNRPIRVCGMVKNEGEPGGGPFWVKSGDLESLQIVESAQIDMKDTSQKKTFKAGTHFNPVDIVCGVKNYKREKFDLLKFRDEETGFISEKSYSGQKLLAMELPGLWNGSMADWNTVFVEVPLITFNPVKTVTDLLKTAHR